MSSLSNPRSQTARAVHAIRQLIFSGSLPAGSSHLEGELADRLAMSRTPIREAGLILESQGLVEVRARKGLTIKPFSMRDVEDILDIQIALETSAIERVVRMGFSRRELEILTNAVDDMEGAAIRNDHEAWQEGSDAFFTELVRLSGNNQLSELWTRCKDQLRRIHTLTLHMREWQQQKSDGYRSLYTAITQGDVALSLQWHKKCRTGVKDDVCDALGKFGLNQV